MRVNRKYLIRALQSALSFTDPANSIHALHYVQFFPTVSTLRVAASNGHDFYVVRIMADGADYWPEPKYLRADTVKALLADLKRVKTAEVDTEFPGAIPGTGDISERWTYLHGLLQRAMPVPARFSLAGVELPLASFERVMKALSAHSSPGAPTMQVVQMLPSDLHAYFFTQEDAPRYTLQILAMCLTAEDFKE